MGRCSPAFRSTFGTNTGIGSQAIVLDGTAEQKARYLPRLATGELIGSFALSEPDAGSDAGSLRTTAELKGNEWVLNGTKQFITNIGLDNASIVLVAAMVGGPDQKEIISMFIVPKDAPGLHFKLISEKLGSIQRGTFIYYKNIH